MALEAPLRSSTGNLQFPFVNRVDMSASPEHEGLRPQARVVSSPPPATNSSSLRPDAANRVSSNFHLMSPSDIVGPSPVTSNGTETTEIEDEVSDDVGFDYAVSEPDADPTTAEPLLLTTTLPENVRRSTAEESTSVIHAPESFAKWKSGDTSSQQSPPINRTTPRSSPKTSPQNDQGSFTSSPSTAHTIHLETHETPSRPPISTDVKPVRYSIDSATPRAQDLDEMLSDTSRLRSSSTSSLEKIDEQTEAESDADEDEDYTSHLSTQHTERDDEIAALRSALQECWTLCNTLANLSSMHRTRVFHSSGTPDAHEKAWQTCWKLCQRLYANLEGHPESLSVRENLDLCRDFCQALFDVRQRKDETADSVLRVSFELNNHLYSAQDSRNLPDVFRERTLDFYITLCHRLMKQRSELAEETDQLLRSCWGVAEMLFSLRQNRQSSRAPDEELLSSAVQACWDLMDIFRDGWTQVRPDRNTPRPSQAGFSPHQPSDGSRAESRTSNRSSYSKRESVRSNSRQEQRPQKPPPVPETPVTEFEDTPVSPESRSPQMPNIMVLGTTSDNGRGGRWSSSASQLSSYSHSSNRTSSTATTTAATEDPNIGRAKALVLRAAMNLGFNRDTVSDPKKGSATLQKFVQALPPGSFGSLTSHATLLKQYKNSVLTDAIIPRHHALPPRGKKVTAIDMAKSIGVITQSSSRYAYLRELFRFVFQFSIDDVEMKRNTSIVV